MKRPLLILAAVAVVAVAAYFACLHFATSHTRRTLGAAGDMVWLRSEFSLTDEQASAIEKLQADYEPRCLEMCARIAKTSGRLEKLLASSTAFSPELDTAVREASQTQADCRAATMAQAFVISAHMPPEHGARYRAMIAARVLPMPLTEPASGHH